LEILFPNEKSHGIFLHSPGVLSFRLLPFTIQEAGDIFTFFLTHRNFSGMVFGESIKKECVTVYERIDVEIEGESLPGSTSLLRVCENMDDVTQIRDKQVYLNKVHFFYV
jgi:hypothetical protein